MKHRNPSPTNSSSHTLCEIRIKNKPETLYSAYYCPPF